MWQLNVGQNFALGNSLFGAVKLTENDDFDKCRCSWYDIGIDANGNFSLFDGSGFGKNIVVFGADMSSSVHVDNEKKYI